MPRQSTARTDMLRSAALLFREKGVEATSVADVIEHAHAPRGSIYHHFPGGRPQLVEEATRGAGDVMGSMIASGIASRGPEHTMASIVGSFRDQLVATDHAAGCPVGAAAVEGPNTPGARDAAGAAFTSWEETIATSLCERGVARDDAERAATLALSAIEGALLMCKAQRSTRPLDVVEEWLVGMMADLLGTASR